MARNGFRLPEAGVLPGRHAVLFKPIRQVQPRKGLQKMLTCDRIVTADS